MFSYQIKHVYPPYYSFQNFSWLVSCIYSLKYTLESFFVKLFIFQPLKKKYFLIKMVLKYIDEFGSQIVSNLPSSRSEHSSRAGVVMGRILKGQPASKSSLFALLPCKVCLRGGGNLSRTLGELYAVCLRRTSVIILPNHHSTENACHGTGQSLT